MQERLSTKVIHVSVYNVKVLQAVLGWKLDIQIWLVRQ